MSFRTLADCRFVVSPFLSLEETSWRLLLRKYGAQLCYTAPVNASDIMKEACLPEALGIVGSDRPLVTQLFSSDSQTLVEAVRKVSHCCDAVDITYRDNSTAAITPKQHWFSWLEMVRQVRSETDATVVCKICLEPSDVDDLLEKIRVITDVGCQFVLLHGGYNGNSARPSLLDKSHWDLIKTVRENASVPLIVDVNCASLHNVNRFLGHTGVQGVSISEPLKGDPAFFLPKKPPMVEVLARDYLALCELCSTPASDAKDSIFRLARVFFSVYPDGVQELMDAQDLQSIALVLDELERRLAPLSKKRVKALEMLHKKKEKYRVKKAEKRIQARNAAGLESTGSREGADSGTDDHVPKKKRKRIQKERAKAALLRGQRIAIDLSLGEEMSDKEISKLAGQLRHLYGSNMRSPSPFHVVFTNLDPSGKIFKEARRQNQGFDNFLVEMTSRHYTDLYAVEEVVFLTPDSANVLQKLEPDKVYVIGGLVDHQVLTNVTQTRAKTHSISSARLPLDEYLERRKGGEGGGNFTFSKVLTVNQVFDVLLKFHETQDWACALMAGVPHRKGFVLKSSHETAHDSASIGGS